MSNGRNNRLAGQIGEYLVCAELARRDYLATPFAGNIPTFDVLATDENFKTVPIQVKASRRQGWQTNAKEWMLLEYNSLTGKLDYDGPRELTNPELIYICVIISNELNRSERDRFFLLTQQQLQKVIVAQFIPWLESHGWKRPKKADSFHCNYNYSSLLAYEDNWQLIKERFLELSSLNSDLI